MGFEDGPTPLFPMENIHMKLEFQSLIDDFLYRLLKSTLE